MKLWQDKQIIQSYVEIQYNPDSILIWKPRDKSKSFYVWSLEEGHKNGQDLWRNSEYLNIIHMHCCLIHMSCSCITPTSMHVGIIGENLESMTFYM